MQFITRKSCGIIFFIFTLGQSSSLLANVQLNGIFSDNMVLQRQMAVPIWGTADPGEMVTVEFVDQKKSVQADVQGKWKIKLDPLQVNSTPQTLTVTGDKTTPPLAVKNVLVGDVWFCGGQSNMEWGINRSTDKDQIIANSTNPLLRTGRIDHNPQMTPQENTLAKWTEASPTTTRFYSAVPYLFGAGLQKELGIPVGIINNAFGGTRIEAWLSADVLKNGPWDQDIYTRLDLAKAEYDKKALAAKSVTDKYLSDKAEALKNHQPVPPIPAGMPGIFRGPTMLWNGEVAPVAGYAIKGFIWNQGENNGDVGIGNRYFELLKALAFSYRKAWDQGDFPLIVMQLCTYYKPGGYAEIREAQLHYVQQDKNSALVVSVDQSDPKGDVHFPDKRVVASRTVSAALGLVYGRPGEYSGPIYDSVKFENGKAILSFQHVDGGLIAKDGPLLHFTIAGEDKNFVEADAKIEGDNVVVSSAQVPQPAAVRYAFSQFPWPAANLFNKAGFPASTFRTDQWPIEKKAIAPPAPTSPLSH